MIVLNDQDPQIQNTIEYKSKNRELVNTTLRFIENLLLQMYKSTQIQIFAQLLQLAFPKGAYHQLSTFVYNIFR